MSLTASQKGRSADFFKERSVVQLKVVIVGEMSVGKTSLAKRFANDTFEDGYQSTVCAGLVSKRFEENDFSIKLNIWDTAGQERFRSLLPMYIRGSDIAYLVYDVTSRESFGNLGPWLSEIRNTHRGSVKIVLVANKCDLEPLVDDFEALEFALANNLQFVKASAKTGENVDGLFRTISYNVVCQLKESKLQTCDMNDTIKYPTGRISLMYDTHCDMCTSKEKHNKCCHH